MEEAREKEFAAFLMENFPPGVRGTSGVYWLEYGEKITATIKDPSSSDKNLRYFVKKNKYELLNIASLVSLTRACTLRRMMNRSKF